MCDYYMKKYITSNYVLIGVPKHMNIGDTLIWQAEKELLDKLDYFIHQVEIAESLRELFILHIKIWANGIQHENFGPNQYGMFRTNDILMMVPEEVYLGNIWGLHTKPLPFWETQTSENQELVIKQYKTILISNMNNLKTTLK